MSRYLTPKSVAEIFGVSYDKVFVWIRNGELRAINVASKIGKRPRWMIKPEEVEAFENRRSASTKIRACKPRRVGSASFF